MPVLLFHGDNTLEIDEAVRDVRTRFAPESTSLLDGSSVSLPALSEAAMTVGLFDPERLVVVTDLHERLKGRKEGEEGAAIRTLLGAVPPSTTLVLVSREMKADHALAKMAREVGVETRNFAAPSKGDLTRWILDRSRRHGAGMERDAAVLLADLAGTDPQALDTEIEKLAIYVGPEGRITPPVVEGLVGAVTQDSIFTLVDAIAGGQQAQALQLLHDQIEGSSSTPIDFALYLIRMLARQVRILLRIRLAQEAGRARREIISEAKIPPYYAERYLQQARRLSKARLIAAFDALASLEYALKSGEADAATGLDLLVTDLCA